MKKKILIFLGFVLFASLMFFNLEQVNYSQETADNVEFTKIELSIMPNMVAAEDGCWPSPCNLITRNDCDQLGWPGCTGQNYVCDAGSNGCHVSEQFSCSEVC